MGRFHVFIIWDPTFYFAAQRNATFGAEAQFQRPINDWRRTGLYAGLINPRVARFRERLHEVHRAAIALFPVVERDVANLKRWHALIFILWVNGMAFQRRNAHGYFECRSRSIV